MVCRKGHAMSRMGKRVLVVLVFACAALTASTLAQVVINEIHYNPPGADGTVLLEFIELHNRGASAVDISNWRLTFGALPFVFPAELVAESVDPKIPIWSLNLGQYREPCKDCETGGTNWQRPFMVIAVKELEQNTNLGEALSDAMTGQSKLPSPKSYSAFELAKFR